ncbi:hypothetical protein E5083_30495 [Streptomyces bauhiniae]|uniref:Uncharacterized protein n=1 Tax=Streptomyces bauhiniae TaxID=2340725 RepID=A0A4Z1CTV5_9ACTN|nr:hypothetical protein [Streptomyces bauhiniae]TGN72264.1 hypothetical protein E5083_30495 [Streptomyces bauhiniae]
MSAQAPARPSMGAGRLRKGAQPVKKVPGLEADRFNGTNVIDPSRVIKGTPQEQLDQVTALLRDARESGEEAVADVLAVGAVNKGLLLAYAKEHDLWQHSSCTSFELWGAEVLEISVKYVHRLVREAAALAKVVALNVRCKKVHRIARPAHAVVIAAVIDQHGEDAALAVIPKAWELAAAENRRRPTAAQFERAAAELKYPVKLITDESDDATPPAPTAPPAVLRTQKTLTRFTAAIGGVRERHIAAMERKDVDAVRLQAEEARTRLSEYIETIDKVYPKKVVPGARPELEGDDRQDEESIAAA